MKYYVIRKVQKDAESPWWDGDRFVADPSKAIAYPTQGNAMAASMRIHRVSSGAIGGVEIVEAPE